MNYIVLDLEWNQASDKYIKDYGLPFEILEIGAVKLNRRMKVIGDFDEIIKPQIYHTIHYITTKIINMDKEELEKGRPFPEVMQEFLEWCGRDSGERWILRSFREIWSITEWMSCRRDR